MRLGEEKFFERCWENFSKKIFGKGISVRGIFV